MSTLTEFSILKPGGRKVDTLKQQKDTVEVLFKNEIKDFQNIRELIFEKVQGFNDNSLENVRITSTSLTDSDTYYNYSFHDNKGIFRDHIRDNALNFHKIRDFCILVMVLDV